MLVTYPEFVPRAVGLLFHHVTTLSCAAVYCPTNQVRSPRCRRPRSVYWAGIRTVDHPLSNCFPLTRSYILSLAPFFFFGGGAQEHRTTREPSGGVCLLKFPVHQSVLWDSARGLLLEALVVTL